MAYDGFTCQLCGSMQDLHPHHIREAWKYPGLRFDPKNGMALCCGCHERVHGRIFDAAHRGGADGRAAMSNMRSESARRTAMLNASYIRSQFADG